MSPVEELVERRASERIPIMEVVEIDLGGARLEATTLDLSTSGVSIWAPLRIRPIGEFTITLTLDHRGAMRIPSRLAREFESDDGAVWGIRFADLPPELAARIEAYVETH